MWYVTGYLENLGKPWKALELFRFPRVSMIYDVDFPVDFIRKKFLMKQYRQKKITPNMHLCLHICECALDYGPFYSFWCYSFERTNGLLGNININII